MAHAFGGIGYLAGHPGEPPVNPGPSSLADYMAAVYGAMGVLLALRARDASGLGQMVDLGLYEAVFRSLDEALPAFAKHGRVREPERLAHPPPSHPTPTSPRATANGPRSPAPTTACSAVSPKPWAGPNWRPTRGMRRTPRGSRIATRSRA